MADFKVREQYDRLAASYDERWRSYVSGTLGFLHSWLRLSGDERVLDVACGTGSLERMLLADHPSLGVVGVDISENMLAVAREKLATHEGASFRRGEAERLPFPEGSFDLVVTANSFHYFDAPLTSLVEMRRVLKPGGRVVILDWCRDFLVCRLCDIVLKLFDNAYNQCYTQRELREMMDTAGFKVEAERRVRQRIVWGIMVADAVPQRS